MAKYESKSIPPSLPRYRSGIAPNMTAASRTWSYSEKSLEGMWSIPSWCWKCQLARRSVDANWDAIRRMPDDALVVTLAMVCPFEPAEKQALLEAPTDPDRAATLLTLLQMGAAANDEPSGRTVS